MKCSECRELLHQEADGEEILGRSSLDQHLRVCTSCRAFQGNLQRMVELASRNRPQPPTAEFSALLLQRVLADQTVSPPEPGTVPQATRSLWFVLLALAASLLVGTGWYAFWMGQGPEADIGLVLVPPSEPEPIVGTLSESVREAGTALSSLTTRTADQVAERTRRILPRVPTPALPPLDPMPPLIDPPGLGLAQAGQVVAEGFQPVTDSARRAFDLFLREVPLPSDPGSGF